MFILCSIISNSSIGYMFRVSCEYLSQTFAVLHYVPSVFLYFKVLLMCRPMLNRRPLGDTNIINSVMQDIIWKVLTYSWWKKSLLLWSRASVTKFTKVSNRIVPWTTQIHECVCVKTSLITYRSRIHVLLIPKPLLKFRLHFTWWSFVKDGNIPLSNEKVPPSVV
jgi:hypothetical protein